MGKLSQDELLALQSAETWEDGQGEDRPAVKAPRAVVSVAFSRDDFERVVERAKQEGMKTSEFIRQAALARANPEQGQTVVVAVTGSVRTTFLPASSPRSRAVVTLPEPPVSSTT